MKDIINTIEEEIRKISSEESIDVQKLGELINIHQRLKGYTIKSVSDIANIDSIPDRTLPVQNIGLMDSLKDVIHVLMKKGLIKYSEDNISSLIEYYYFIEKLKNHSKDEINFDAYNLSCAIAIRIMDKIRKLLNEDEEEFLDTSITD